MKKCGALLLVLASLTVALATAQSAAGPEIRLVLLIVVDQFRYGNDWFDGNRGDSDCRADA